MYKCPNCEALTDINAKDSSHQVNDNNEETYCSFECSAVGTLKLLEEKMQVLIRFSGGQTKANLIELLEMIENT